MSCLCRQFLDAPLSEFTNDDHHLLQWRHHDGQPGHDEAPRVHGGDPAPELTRIQHVHGRHGAWDDDDEQEDAARAPHDGGDLALAEDLLHVLVGRLLVPTHLWKLIAVELQPGVQGVVDVSQLQDIFERSYDFHTAV